MARKGSRVHFDAIFRVPLRAEIGDVQVIKEGFVIHLSESRSPQTESAWNSGSLQSNPFFVNKVVRHPIHVVKQDKLGK